MINFDWSNVASTLKDFGGKAVTLYVSKTGLPFFDVLRLYGVIDLYIGLREDVIIHDAGNEWEVKGYSRKCFMDGRDEQAFKQIWKKKKPQPKDYCDHLKSLIFERQLFVNDESIEVGKNIDAILQDGIRGISAYSYETLQTGQTSKKECKELIPLSQGLFAFAGKKRTESIGNIVFLPVFEGKIDLSRVVSPLRAWFGMPNVICSQALTLLSLKTALFTEGYQKKLSAVVFNTNLGNQRSDNYSGVIAINSTAISRINSSDFINHLYRVFWSLVSKAWTKEYSIDVLAMAYWLMQPVGKHLSSMIISQEKMKAKGFQQIFIKSEFVKEVFNMSYGDWKGDHEAVRKFAKAVASAIYYARPAKEKTDKNEKGKKWYDEVVMLRSAPTAKAFIERALILIEQGHCENSQIGTVHRDEVYDPSTLFASIGEDRSEFETFRDLFRMYLIQESTYKVKEVDDIPPSDVSESDNLTKKEEE